jgi:TetR/AcrR family transcriptional regulator, regulator of autoinduction and epiphytic fitness
MVKQIPLKRKYNSSRREFQSRQTRLLIAEAARILFLERGYAGATINAIARQAGVAQETVYAIFGNKLKILAFILDISVGGDDKPVRLLDRPEPQAVLHNTDQHQQVARFSQGITEILTRAAPIIEIMRSASKTEPEIAKLLQKRLQGRLQNMVQFVYSVFANGPLRKGLNETRAAETVWAITSPELFQLLTVDRGWSKEKYSQWLADSLSRLLLP